MTEEESNRIITHHDFSEDNFFRTMTNLRLSTKNICRTGHTITNKDESQMYIVVEEAEGMAYLLYNKFSEQFKHNPRARSICPNPKCHSIYAYFFEDWRCCPKCGTKLEFTYDMNEQNNE